MWRLGWIAQQIGGKLVEPEKADLLITGNVDFDSRALQTGGLYVSRVGENTDGNDYLPAAASNGAIATIIDQRSQSLQAAKMAGLAAITVDDPTIALGCFARAHLRALRWSAQRSGRLEPLVVAITGSVGKTTTKDLLARLLSTQGTVIAPKGSYNNETGLPVTVLQATEDTSALVLEMGASGPGQLTYLAALTGIDIALELMVGHAHLGGFGSAQGLANAKAEMLRGLRKFSGEILSPDTVKASDNDLLEALWAKNQETIFAPPAADSEQNGELPNSPTGTVLTDPSAQRESQIVLNAADPYVSNMARGPQVTFFGISSVFDNPTANLKQNDFANLPIDLKQTKLTLAHQVKLNSIGQASFLLEVAQSKLPVQLGLFGQHQVYNALAAAAVAELAGVPAREIALVLNGQAADSPHRLKVVTTNDRVIIDDSYNANLDSMKAGLAVLELIANSESNNDLLSPELPGNFSDQLNQSSLPSRKRKIAVLGEMLELGEYTQAHHEEIGIAAAEAGVDRLIGVGENAKYLVDAYLKALSANAPSIIHCSQQPVKINHAEAWHVLEAAQAINIIEQVLAPNDVVLLKGSSGSKVWQVADYLLATEEAEKVTE